MMHALVAAAVNEPQSILKDGFVLAGGPVEFFVARFLLMWRHRFCVCCVFSVVVCVKQLKKIQLVKNKTLLGVTGRVDRRTHATECFTYVYIPM